MALINLYSLDCHFADISARGFYEPILVTEFIGKYLNIRDLTRPLSEQIRVKVRLIQHYFIYISLIFPLA